MSKQVLKGNVGWGARAFSAAAAAAICSALILAGCSDKSNPTSGGASNYVIKVAVEPVGTGYIERLANDTTRAKIGDVKAGDSINVKAKDSVTLKATGHKDALGKRYKFTKWEFASGDTSTKNPLVFTPTKNDSLTANFEDAYIIQTLTPAGGPILGGSIVYSSDSSTGFLLGDTVTLTAKPDTGWTFTGWTRGVISNAASIKIVVAGDSVVTPTFKRTEYTILINNDETKGTVTRKPDRGVFYFNDTLTLTVTPRPGFTFTGWTGSQTWSDSIIGIRVRKNDTLTTSYATSFYRLSITTDTTQGRVAIDSTSESGMYAHGKVRILTVTPETGYTFTGWTGSTVSSANPLSVTMDGDKGLTANFEKTKYTLTTSSTPSQGTVGLSPQPTAGRFEHGTVVTATAAPQFGYEFVAWSGASEATTSPITITMDGNKTLTATFKLKEYTFAVGNSNTSMGTVTVAPTPTAGTKYPHGTVFTITATPNIAGGFYFAKWSSKADGAWSNDTQTVRITLIRDDSLTANFAAIPAGKFALVLTSSPANVGGSISANPYKQLYDAGDVVGLVAKKLPGYDFAASGWSANVTPSSKADSGTIVMTANTTVTATFVKMNRLTVAVSPTAGGSVTANPLSESGESQGYYLPSVTAVTLTASANPGYTFTRWDGAATGTTASATVTMNGDKGVSAIFTPNTYTISVSANPTTGGTVSGGGSVLYDDAASVSASPATGWEFDGWYEAGILVPNAPAEYGFTVSGNRSLEAKFSKIQYTISLSPACALCWSDYGYVVTSSPQTYDYDDYANVVAAPASSGYTFNGWYEAGTRVSQSLSYGFNVRESRNLVARYAKNSYTFTVYSAAGGSVSPVGTLTYGYLDTVTLSASANTGFVFNDWVDKTPNIEQLPSTIPHVTKFVIRGSGSVRAHFLEEGQRVALRLIGNMRDGKITVRYSEQGGTFESSYAVDSNALTNLVYIPRGATVHLSAEPYAGNDFDYWRFDAPGTVPSYSPTLDGFGMDNAYGVYFYFKKAIYHVIPSVNNSEWGRYTVSPGSGEGYDYTYDEVATLTATAEDGYSFVRWTYTDENGVVQNPTTNEITIKMRSSVSPIATFSVRTYSVTATVTPLGVGAGTATNLTGLAYGAPATLTAAPNEGYRFVNWTYKSNGADMQFGTALTVTLASVTSDTVVYANFERKKYKLTLGSLSNGSITVYINNTPQPSAPDSITHFDVVKLVATPNSGYAVKGGTWSVKDSENAEKTYFTATDDGGISFTAVEAVTASVQFVKAHKVTVKAASNMGTANLGGTVAVTDMTLVADTVMVEDNQEISLTAIKANDNFNFVAWVGSGVGVGDTLSKSEMNLNNVKIDSDTVLTAYFKRDTLRLSLNGTDNPGTVTVNSANPAKAGQTSDGDSLYWKGTTFTLSAKAPTDENKTYRFDGWYIGTAKVGSTENSFPFTLLTDTTIIAKYVETFKVTFSLGENEPYDGTVSIVSGINTVNGDNYVDNAGSVVFTVTPNSGKKVGSVKKGEGENDTLTPGDDGNYTVDSVSGEITITITFEEDT